MSASCNSYPAVPGCFGEASQQCLVKVLSNLRYLQPVARQGIALSGNGDESNLNIMQFLRLRQNEDLRIKDWINRKTITNM